MSALSNILPFLRPEKEAVRFQEVKEKELIAIAAKRTKCNQNQNDLSKNLFGIALSGGGIRSATLNLGVLEVLNQAGILSKADYLSTVSGGGYIGSYLQAKLRTAQPGVEKPEEAYKDLFSKEDKKRLKEFGYYLAPNKPPSPALHRLRMWGAFVFSLAMSWICIILFFLAAVFFFKAVFGPVFECSSVVRILWIATGAVLAWHFFVHPFRHWKLWPSGFLTWVEGVLLFLLAAYLVNFAFEDLAVLPCLCCGLGCPSCLTGFWLALADLGIVLTGLFIAGFFANPNLLSMHRFYRDRLADAFMGTGGAKEPSRMLHKLNLDEGPENWGFAPYPLINTCLNLFETGKKPKAKEKTGTEQVSEAEPGFAGSKASDYFLLSPLYCGSKLTGYVSAKSTGYEKMTVSTATAISGAALNPSMGTKSNRLLSFFMALLNLKLGYWAVNPKSRVKTPVVWWPVYLFAELFGRAVTKMWRVNLSDGGHIENLGIYELLRRRCKLIIAIDAGEDSKYDFSDLRNLVVRARNELGIAINFKQPPEEIIRPSPSGGFSKSQFAIADLEMLPEVKGGKNTPFGALVYLKSSMLAPETFKEKSEEEKKKERESALFESLKYKTYHPEFPHESTADQFFEPAQWEAYYNLGRFMAGDLINVDVRDGGQLSNAKVEFGSKTIDELHNLFSNRNPLQTP